MAGDDLVLSGTIGDPGSDPDPVVAFGSSGDTVLEGNSIDIPVTLANFAGPVTAQVALVSGETSWFDTSFPQPVAFSADGTQNVTVNVLDDGVYTGPRTATFTLSVTSGTADVGVPSTFTLTIDDSSTPPAPEGVLVRYEFTGNSPVANAVASGLSASDFGISAGSLAYGSAQAGDWDQGSGVPYVQGNAGWGATSQAEAKYFEFTVTPDPEQTLLVNQLDFAHRRTAAGPEVIGITIGETVVLSGYALEDSVTEYDTFPFPEIAITGPTTIRIEGWLDGGGSSGAGQFRLDDVTLRGVVDGDTPLAPQVAFSTSSASAEEGESVAINVVLSNYDSTPVEVDVALTTGDPGEFVPAYTTQTLTFNNNGTQTINLDLNDDGIWTGDRNVVFTLQNITGDPNAEIGSPNTFTLTILETTPPPPMSIAAARAAGVGATVTVEGVVSRAMGAFTYFQDETAGLTIRQVSGDFFDAVEDETITTGTRINVTGTLSAFNGLLQINLGDLQDFDILEQGVALTPQVITLADLDGDSHQAQLVTIHGLTLPDGETGTWSSATSYDVTDGTETTELRVPNAADNNIAGEAIPEGTFSFTGIVGHFNAPQLMAILSTDIYEFVNISVGASGEGEGWRMLSSPVIGATVADLAAVNLVHGIPGEYPNTDDTNILTAYDGTEFVAATGLSDPLIPGKGFIWYMWGVDHPHGEGPPEGIGSSTNQWLPISIEYSGVSPVFENYSVTFTADEHPTATGWYLIGNPYGQAYDLRGITVPGASHSGTFHHWDPTDGPLGAYDEYDAVDTDPVLVAPGLGFFIEIGGDAAHPLEITFGPYPPSGIRDVAERFSAHFELTGNLLVELDDETYTLPVGDRNARVIFSQDATDDFDILDAGKLTPLSDYWATIALVGLNNGEQVLRSTESRPVPLEAITIPMTLSTFLGEGNELDAAGTFTITLAENLLGTGWLVSLHDLETGATVNMLTDSYTFSIESQPAIDADQRFEIIFTPPTVSGEGSGEGYVFGLEAVWPNPTSTTAQVAFTLEASDDVTLDVFDVLGRRVAQVASGEYGAGRHVLPLNTNDLASGVYVVRLTSGIQTAVQRVTVAR